ncbi:C-type lectin domain family 10 member A-like isoform 3-T3 [Menidia menidia]
MESSQNHTNYRQGKHFGLPYEIFGRVAERCAFPNHRVVILSLGLLNAVLFISAVAIGVKCAELKAGSLQQSHSATSQLISELSFLRSNHSDVIEAEEEAKRELGKVISNHAQLKKKTEQLRTISDDFWKQIVALRADKANLQANISVLEGTCGSCSPGWDLLNSSCYFFSYTESRTVKKNWPDSRADCRRRGSDLIVIDNPEEQTFVSNSIEDMRSGRDIWQNGFWIGITDEDTEGTWIWINNVTEVEQRYWMDGEPNNAGNTGEHCGVALPSSNNPWKTRYDGKCHQQTLHWICEMRKK